MSRRTKIRRISFGLAAFGCAVMILFSSYFGAGRFETRIHAETARALGTAITAVGSLDRSLQRCACATTPVMENVLCTEIYSDAKQAELALSVLPVRSDSLEQIARHISIVGDYAQMLSRSNASGKRFSASELDLLRQFSENTSLLFRALTELQSEITDGTVMSEAFLRITDSLDNLESKSDLDIRTMETVMQRIASKFPTVPALVYDGMYSDHEQETALGLSDLPDCNSESAERAAASWLGLRSADALKLCKTQDTQIPGYCFSGEVKGERVSVFVTKAGAKILWYVRDQESQESKYSVDEAAEFASSFLEAHGFHDMALVQRTVSGGVATLRYVYVQDGEVFCCPDEIMVSVSLSTGDVLSFQASDFWLHHILRDVSAFKDGQKLAESAIPSFLQITTVKKAVVNVFGGSERACYVVDCVDESGATYRIVVNAQSGEQEKIFLPDEIADTFV